MHTNCHLKSFTKVTKIQINTQNSKCKTIQICKNLFAETFGNFKKVTNFDQENKNIAQL